MSQEIDLIREQTRRDFSELTLAMSLPEILFIYAEPHVLAGAAKADLTVGAFNLDEHRYAMSKMWFYTPNRVHGLLHYQGPVQLFFLGYLCTKCGRVFLVPDIKSIDDLSDKMRHACHV
jgi:hypothetical protein